MNAKTLENLMITGIKVCTVHILYGLSLLVSQCRDVHKLLGKVSFNHGNLEDSYDKIVSSTHTFITVSLNRIIVKLKKKT